MNIYMIENRAEKAAHLQSFLNQFSGAVGIQLEVPDGWGDCVAASTCFEKVWSALNDCGGIILLDYHLPDEPHKAIATELLNKIDQAIHAFERWFELFGEDENYALCSAVLAVSEFTGARVLVCSTARFLLPPEIQIAVNNMHVPDIPWPESPPAYTWSAGHIATFRGLAESHWRAPYDKAARLWKNLSDVMKSLFPSGCDDHHASWHIKPENIDKSTLRAKTAFDAFANEWASNDLQCNLKELASKFTNEDILYVAKTADNHNGVAIALLCEILDCACAKDCRKCKAAITGAQPGAILLAFICLKASRAANAGESNWKINCVDEDIIRICMETKFTDQQYANDAKEALGLTPSQQITNVRPAPGTATLAMDYLRKLDPELTIKVVGNKLILELNMRKETIA